MIMSLFRHPIGRAFAIYFTFVFGLALMITLLTPVLFPLILAFILFSILEPIKNRLIRGGLSQLTAIILVLMAVMASGIICLVIGIPMLLDQWEWLQTRLPIIATKIAQLLDTFGSSIANSVGMQVDTRLGERWLADLKDQGTSVVVSSAGIMVQSAFSLVFIPIVTFFLMRDYRKMRNTLMSWLPNKAYELGWLIYFRVTKRLQRYVHSVFIQSAIVAFVTTIGFYIIGLDTAVLFGVLAGLLNLIPYIGPLLSLLPPMLSTLGSGAIDIWMLVSIAMVILAAQIFDNVVVIPNLIAQTVDLHPMMVLFGVVVFGYLFGFLGMIIAIPVLTASKFLLMGLIHGLNKKLTEDTLHLLPAKLKS